MPRARCIASYSGNSLQRRRRRSVDDLGEEDLQLATGAVDGLADGARLVAGSARVVQRGELALDLVGVGDDGVEPDHLDRPRRLMDVRARVLQRRGRAAAAR